MAIPFFFFFLLKSDLLSSGCTGATDLKLFTDGRRAKKLLFYFWISLLDQPVCSSDPQRPPFAGCLCTVTLTANWKSNVLYFMKAYFVACDGKVI